MDINKHTQGRKIHPGRPEVEGTNNAGEVLQGPAGCEGQSPSDQRGRLELIKGTARGSGSTSVTERLNKVEENDNERIAMEPQGQNLDRTYKPLP